MEVTLTPVITTILAVVVVAGITSTTVATREVVAVGHMVVESLLMYNVRFITSMVMRQPIVINL